MLENARYKQVENVSCRLPVIERWFCFSLMRQLKVIYVNFSDVNAFILLCKRFSESHSPSNAVRMKKNINYNMKFMEQF